MIFASCRLSFFEAVTHRVEVSKAYESWILGSNTGKRVLDLASVHVSPAAALGRRLVGAGHPAANAVCEIQMGRRKPEA